LRVVLRRCGNRLLPVGLLGMIPQHVAQQDVCVQKLHRHLASHPFHGAFGDSALRRLPHLFGRFGRS
jgi:hypothetical protein